MFSDYLPHISLSVKNNDHRQDVGLFVKICIFHVNWVETAEKKVEYNPTLSAYRMCLHGTAVKAVRTVYVIHRVISQFVKREVTFFGHHQ